MRIPDTLLLAVCSFGRELSAERVAHAIAKGVCAAGMPAPDQCPIGDTLPPNFDARMRRARAVIVGADRLQERTLAGATIFEVATRARQAGVPAYAVIGENRLDPFDARILDLQAIFEADSARALVAAGRKLAGLTRAPFTSAGGVV